MPTYDVECQACGNTKEIHCSYTERNNLVPCDCGGKCKKIVSGFALGTGMYNQKVKKYSSQQSDQIAELRSLGVEKISASTQGFSDTCKSLLSEKNRVADQMAMGAERQQRILAEKVKASKPSAGEVKRLEKIFSEKNVPRGTNKKPK